jgi:hypothetical protein
MALTFISENAQPSYIALSTDIDGGTIDGVSHVGRLIYITDTAEWYVIEEDLTLSAYSLPVNVGNINVGAVNQGTPGNQPWPVSASGGVAITDGANLDAFSRLRVSLPKVVFNSNFKYDLDTFQYWQSTVIGGTITHNANLVSAQMSVNNDDLASCVLQSKQYTRYIPAKSQMIVTTQVIGAGVANVLKRVGYFDSLNGIFLEQDGTALNIVVRTSTSGAVVDTNIPQANWNMDALDGNGASEIVFDPSKASILVIDLQWLGMGRVRVGFDIDGQIMYVHEFLNANNLSVPYMQTATLPVRWEISNVGISSGSTLYATCAAVLSEGGDEEDIPYQFSANNVSDVTASTSRTGLLAIRPKATYNGLINRMMITPDEFSGIAGNNPVLIELIYNPTTLTVTGGWTSANANSGVEYHPTITVVTGGTVVYSYFVPSSNTLRGSVQNKAGIRLPIVLDIAGANPIPLVVCATALNSTSACRGRITWKELR